MAQGEAVSVPRSKYIAILSTLIAQAQAWPFISASFLSRDEYVLQSAPAARDVELDYV